MTGNFVLLDQHLWRNCHNITHARRDPFERGHSITCDTKAEFKHASKKMVRVRKAATFYGVGLQDES
jgi:hypothetical protein